MNFKDEFKRIRLERGLTQEELARKSNIALSTIKKYSNGTMEPSPEYCDRLAQVLEIDSFELYSLTKAFSGVAEHVLNRLDAIQKLEMLVDNPEFFRTYFDSFKKQALLLSDLVKEALDTDDKGELEELLKIINNLSLNTSIHTQLIKGSHNDYIDDLLDNTKEYIKLTEND